MQQRSENAGAAEGIKSQNGAMSQKDTMNDTPKRRTAWQSKLPTCKDVLSDKSCRVGRQSTMIDD